MEWGLTPLLTSEDDESQDQNLLAHLRENAAWLIMDPWKKSPSVDTKKYPQLEDINRRCLDRILDHLPKIKHACVSSPSPVFEELNHLPNMRNSFENFTRYLNSNQLSEIVYCGFHYGICILFKPDGAAHINNKSFPTVVSKWNDVWDMFKGADWPNRCELNLVNALPEPVREEVMSIPELRYFVNMDLASLRKKDFGVHIMKNLCCMFPESNENEMDELSKKYANII